MAGRCSRLYAVIASLLVLTGAAKHDPRLVIRSAPGAPDAARHVPFVDVTLVVQGMHVAAGEPLFAVPLVANTVVTSGKDLQGLAMADGAGRIAASARDTAEDESNTQRTWRASRAVDGVVTVRYRVPIDAAAPPLALPQYEMRTEDGTFSAAGTAVLLLPADTRSRRVEVHWDFAAFGKGGVGESSSASATSRPGRRCPRRRWPWPITWRVARASRGRRGTASSPPGRAGRRSRWRRRWAGPVRCIAIFDPLRSPSPFRRERGKAGEG